VKAVRDSAYHIIDYTGEAYFAIGQAMVWIVGAVLLNQKSMLNYHGRIMRPFTLVAGDIRGWN
jgi:malate/lactate dehydrogenase